MSQLSALGKLLDLSVTIILLWELNELIHKKHSELLLAHGEPQ